MKKFHGGFAHFFVIIGVLVFIIVIGVVAQIFNSQKKSAESVLSQGESKTANWKTYQGDLYEFQYPAEYNSQPKTYSVGWGGGGDGMGDSHYIHIEIKEKSAIHAFQDLICEQGLCQNEAKERITFNGIEWEYLGISRYCDVGVCTPNHSVYRTMYDSKRFYMMFENENQERDILATLKFRVPSDVVTYIKSNFPRFSYPKDMKIKEGDNTEYPSVVVYPLPQPIEFGPFLSVTLYGMGAKDLVANIQDQYKGNLISHEIVKVSNLSWIHAVIRDDYFGTVQNEYYFLPFRGNKYIAVVYSKNDPHARDFYKILSTIDGN